MGNPKFIPTKKKVTYSFRIEEGNLEKLKKISELNDIKLPNLMNNLINEYLYGKTIYNTYVEDLKGMFIDLPDITQGESYEELSGGEYYNSNLTFEYEVKKIPCNLEYWSDIYNSYRCFFPNEYKHEGIEFLIVPELCEYENRCYTDLTKYLYCIHFLVDKNYRVRIDYISFMEAINKIKKCENYPLLNHALKIKETLEMRTEEIQSQIYMRNQKGEEVSEFEFVWTELKYLSKMFNTGNIIPIEMSREDIMYKASLQSINDEETFDIIAEFQSVKKELSKFEELYKLVYKYLESQGLSEEEISDIMNKDKPTFDLTDS